MTVKELIKILQTYDANLQVISWSLDRELDKKDFREEPKYKILWIF